MYFKEIHLISRASIFDTAFDRGFYLENDYDMENLIFILLDKILY